MESFEERVVPTIQCSEINWVPAWPAVKRKEKYAPNKKRHWAYRLIEANAVLFRNTHWESRRTGFAEQTVVVGGNEEGF